jgi:hypothetical protein
MNRFEYDNTVRDLFADASRPAQALPFDAFADPATHPVSAALVEGYHELAHDFAARVTEDAAAATAFVGCDPASDGEDACRREFISKFIARVFRRESTTADLEEFARVFDTGVMLRGDFSSGVRAVVEVALQSPEFLYRPEFGEPADDRGEGWARPSSYEMASRLSYLLWGSTPDAELLEAAANGALGTPDEVAAQARRLLADARARDVVGYFYLRLLGLHGATFSAAGDAAHPTFTSEIAGQLLDETKAFVAEVTLGEQGDFSMILTAPFTFVNEPLAAFYGITGVSGDEYQRAAVDPAKRGGLLTHGSFLAATARGPLTDPSQRGFRIASALLCSNVPEEPPDLPRPPVELPPDTTTRQFYESQVAGAACQDCHSMFDPLGFAFEHYDAAGLWRETENGFPIDATGSAEALEDFDGALELAQRLTGSEDARRCFVQNWFAFAQGRATTTADACFLEELDHAFTSEAANLYELLVALTQSDAFLYRPW